jgi:nicotinamide-nucleotide adenylyltransferase
MRGFFIGRFQPFHNGHRALVEGMAEEVDELVLGVGSAGQSHTPRNPFTAGERVVAVERAVDHIDVTTYTVPIEDIERHSIWVSHVRSMTPPFDVAYSNNPLVIRLFKEAGIEVRQTPMVRRHELEGSEIRDRIVDGRPWRDLVPAPVVEAIEEIDGARRLRRIAETDANGGGRDDDRDGDR